MKRSSIVLIVIAALVVLLTLYGIIAYNRFVSLDQSIQGRWSEVENQYQRQADLIPNLVSVVSSSVRAETTFVQSVIAARTEWQAAQGEQARDQAGVAMSDSVATFVSAVAEDYPEFNANTQYIALTDELAGTQNRITVARGRYIESIQAYNTATYRFPSNIIARLFGFDQRDYYRADSDSLTTPELGTGELP